MSVYVYAIVDQEARPLPRRCGLGGGPLVTIPYRSLAAVVSEEAGAPRRDEGALLRHEAIVEALGHDRRTLPVRFGTVLPDEHAVEEAIAAHYPQLAADLERLGDKVELGLLVIWRTTPEHADRAPEPPADAPRGARYLAQRRRAYTTADASEATAREVADELDEAVRACTVDRRRSIVTERKQVLRVAYLTTPAQVETVRRAVDAVRRRRPELATIVSGPWPPYSFVSPPRAP